jgi:hypothetical protein
MRIIADYAEGEPNIRVAGDACCSFSLVYRMGSLLDWSEKEKLKPTPVNKTENVTLTLLLPDDKIEA